MLDAALTLADMGWNDHMGGDWGGGWWILMVVGMVVFWGLVVLGVVWMVRSRGQGEHGHGGHGAHELLDQRFARGEISPEEYRERRELLRDQGGGGEG